MNSVLYCLHNLSQKSHLRRMEKFTQHGDTSCLLHTIAVAYYSIKIAEFFGIKYKKRDLIRGALLHDYFLYDQGDVIGSICVNLDITETLQFEGYLRQFNQFDNFTSNDEEIFAPDVNNLLSHLIQMGQEQVGKPALEMNKNEKIEFIRFLDQKGAFLITKSGEQICELLGISKFTFYNYLEISRSQSDSSDSDQT